VLAYKSRVLFPKPTPVRAVHAVQFATGSLVRRGPECGSGTRVLPCAVTETRIVLMAAKQEPNVLLCMQNRTNCILLVSVMDGRWLLQAGCWRWLCWEVSYARNGCCWLCVAVGLGTTIRLQLGMGATQQVLRHHRGAVMMRDVGLGFWVNPEPSVRVLCGSVGGAGRSGARPLHVLECQGAGRRGRRGGPGAAARGHAQLPGRSVSFCVVCLSVHLSACLPVCLPACPAS
jgi:hypothetical protein